jgi:hypothetical protein
MTGSEVFASRLTVFNSTAGRDSVCIRLLTMPSFIEKPDSERDGEANRGHHIQSPEGVWRSNSNSKSILFVMQTLQGGPQVPDLPSNSTTKHTDDDNGNNTDDDNGNNRIKTPKIAIWSKPRFLSPSSSRPRGQCRNQSRISSLSLLGRSSFGLSRVTVEILTVPLP